MFKKKTRISIFTDCIQVGGGPMGYTYNMIQGSKSLGKIDFNIKFIGYDNSLSPKSSGIVEIIRKIQRRFYRYSIAIKRRIELRKSDICVFQGWQEKKWAEAAKRNGKICVYMPHSPSIMADEQKMNWELSNNSPYDMFVYKRNYETEENLFKISDYIVFPSKNASQAYYEKWKSIIDEKKVFYIKSGTINRTTENSYPIREQFCGKIIFAFIGRYVTHKGFDVFCNAAKKFKDDDKLVFVSAGTGPMEGLAEANNVHNLGFISDIGSLIKNIDVLVIPNRIAYYDLLPIECAAYGKPMIFSHVGGNIDQLAEFPDSLTFTSENTNDLCEKIKLALIELEKNKSWGKNNQTVYYEDFTEKEMMKRWISFFEKIVSDIFVCKEELCLK